MEYIALTVREIHYPEGFSTQRETLFPEQIEKYSFLINKAAQAKAYPSQSGFFVKTAGITEHGKVWTGGNKEYSLSDAFAHGEEAVVSALKDQTGERVEAIAWYRDKETGPGDFGRPCGKCRDVLKEFCDPELVLLNGNEKAFVYTKFKDFLFDNFQRLNLDHVNSDAVFSAINAIKKGTKAYLPEVLKPRVYGAALISQDGTIWQGSHYSNVGYDAVTPILSSILGWKNDYPQGIISDKSLRLQKVVVVSEIGIPDVYYRDRQAILEMDEILRRYTKSSQPLRVHLVHARKDERGNLFIYDAKRTNTEEWLPNPFSPGVFRMDDVMDAQLQELIGKNG